MVAESTIESKYSPEDIIDGHRERMELHRLRVEVEAWRSGRLSHTKHGRFLVHPTNDWKDTGKYDDITDAVDALMEEAGDD